jgi:hypothetical protein
MCGQSASDSIGASIRLVPTCAAGSMFRVGRGRRAVATLVWKCVVNNYSVVTLIMSG